MNEKFKRLAKPRITKLDTSMILGLSLPRRTKTNSSIVGIFIDGIIRKWIGSSTGVTTGVDLHIFGIEVKSQDVSTSSNWTIGTMTFDDIIDTNYVDSSLYQKLQSLFLIGYDNDLCIITEANLYYLDNDEIQGIFENAYETARREAIAYKIFFKETVGQREIVFGDENIEFDNSQQFKGGRGYCLEYINSGSSFKFRISNKEMKRVTSLAIANNNPMFTFN